MGGESALSRGRVLLSAVLLLSAVGCLVYSQQGGAPDSVELSDSKAEVLAAAKDIAMVLADSRKDDTLGKSIEARSKTHAVSDGATRLVTNLKALHTQANAKKAASSADMSAITSALDISKAGGKEVKMAKEQALAIEKILAQSKHDLGDGALIEDHSKDHEKHQWSNFWASKHSLVSRLAGE
ncbi:hypothetical protein T484DRAFT_1922325, partial [Baffinella frigidus]